MRKVVDHINAIPSKRLFHSIIADYDLNRAICELIDNAIDLWIRNKKIHPITIEIEFDPNQQTLQIMDNAGGIKKSDLHVIVSPGHTSNRADEETIGMFGVGTKRAVVALSQDIKIKSRYRDEQTYQIEFNDAWIQDDDDDWGLDIYEETNIAEGSTIIELQKLRIKINNKVIDNLIEHLETTYGRFLDKDKIIIKFNGNEIKPKLFENWAYPPEYPPRKYFGDLPIIDEGKSKIVKLNILAGLSMESSPSGEYGVYFYCNDRLIIKNLKTIDVGFTSGLVGKPHPDLSLIKIIVSLSGEARLMPWNSSKSDIFPNHPVFIAIREWLIEITKNYASISRRLSGEWPEKVFKYPTGQIVDVPIDNFSAAKKSYLLPMPPSKPGFKERIEQKNILIAEEKPWVKGLYESIIAVDMIYKRNFEQKNRICLIILDSTLEIAFKEFLVNDSGTYYSDRKIQELFQFRNVVQDEIIKYNKVNPTLWKKINFYYGLRCKLVHERTTIGITDNAIEDYRQIVQKVLNSLFNLDFN